MVFWYHGVTDYKIGNVHRKGRDIMVLSAPTKIVFLISLVLAALALIASFGVAIPVVSGNALWVALIAYAVLAVGNLLKGV